jgi:hypothetical protein
LAFPLPLLCLSPLLPFSLLLPTFPFPPFSFPSLSPSLTSLLLLFSFPSPFRLSFPSLLLPFCFPAPDSFFCFRTFCSADNAEEISLGVPEELPVMVGGKGATFFPVLEEFEFSENPPNFWFLYPEGKLSLKNMSLCKF